MSKPSDFLEHIEIESAELASLVNERDFLADQVDRLETVIDEKQDTIDLLTTALGFRMVGEYLRTKGK